MSWSVISTPENRRAFSGLVDDAAALKYCNKNLGRYLYHLHAAKLTIAAFSPIQKMEPVTKEVEDRHENWKFNVRMAFVGHLPGYVGLVPKRLNDGIA